MLDKTSLRRALAERRRAMSSADRSERSARAQARLIESTYFGNARTVALYRPMGNEVDTALLRQAALDAGKRLAYPQIGDHGTLAFVLAEADSGWTLGPRGFEVPAQGPMVPIGELDLMVLPGLAFDVAGHRLGRGAGHYDRSLANLPRPIAVGLAYDFQLVERVPTDPWDVPLDAVAAEGALHRAQAGSDR